MNGYGVVLASDVALRDGLGLELYDPSGRQVAEVFRDDADGSQTFSCDGALTLDRDVLSWFLGLASEALRDRADEITESSVDMLSAQEKDIVRRARAEHRVMHAMRDEPRVGGLDPAKEAFPIGIRPDGEANVVSDPERPRDRG